MKEDKKNKDYRAEFFEKSEMLISLYDKNLNLLDANTAFLKALRFEKKDILGKNISVISPDCKPSGRYAIYEDIIKTGKTFVTDQVRLHPSLGSIYIRLTAFKVGEGLGISSKEITDLMETIDDLETFIYKTSHDVRSPISTTLGLINVAQHDLKDNAMALHYLGMLKQQAETLDQIVMRLLETTKIRQGKTKLHLIDFEEEISQVIFSFSTTEGFDRIRFEKNIQVTHKFYSDKALVCTIFQNLIHNAIKYRGQDRKDPYIRIHVADEGRGIKITIADNGIGISEEAQKEVFKMFFRGTSIASGSGLGLYTVKHCVKKLGGQISLESKAGEGTTFSIYLPNASDE
ncbi:MAG: PAS domain-containing sensor histidine kinase [Bacteroidetes bacterium]|nr:PAS domain-containing sensor histidine kinase [Bacteroidota bacterium]